MSTTKIKNYFTSNPFSKNKTLEAKMFKYTQYETVPIIDFKNGITIFVGRNGVGKTTLFNYLEKKNDLMYVHSDNAEETDSVFSLHDVSDILNFKNKAAMRLIKYFEIENLIDAKYKNLSGGEKKLITFIFAFLKQDNIILIDEPEKNLSIENLEKLIILINKNKIHCSFNIVTHNELFFQRIKKNKVYFIDNKISMVSNKVNWGDLWK